MIQITTPIATFTYHGLPLVLPSASFAGNVDKIFRLNGPGSVFVGYKSGAAVNAFTTLEDGGTYIVYSHTTPYTIPTTDITRPQASTLVYTSLSSLPQL